MKKMMAWVLTCAFVLTAVFAAAPMRVSASNLAAVTVWLDGKSADVIYVKEAAAGKAENLYVSKEFESALGAKSTVTRNKSVTIKIGGTVITAENDSTKILVENGDKLTAILVPKSAASVVYTNDYTISLAALCDALGYEYTYNSKLKSFAIKSPLSADDFTVKVGRNTIDLTTATASDIVKATGIKFKKGNNLWGDFYSIDTNEAVFDYEIIFANSEDDYGVIVTLAESVATPRGIKKGSAESALLKAYPEPDEIADLFGIETIYYFRTSNVELKVNVDVKTKKVLNIQYLTEISLPV